MGREPRRTTPPDKERQGTPVAGSDGHLLKRNSQGRGAIEVQSSLSAPLVDADGRMIPLEGPPDGFRPSVARLGRFPLPETGQAAKSLGDASKGREPANEILFQKGGNPGLLGGSGPSGLPLFGSAPAHDSGVVSGVLGRSYPERSSPASDRNNRGKPAALLRGAAGKRPR